MTHKKDNQEPLAPFETEDAGKEKKSFPKVLLDLSVKYVLPLAITVYLVAYLFRKVSFADMWEIISHGVNYWWILLAMSISILSHVTRAARWRIQLRALGMNPSLMMLSCSIFGTYGLNLVFPRLGEVWRCAYVAKQEKTTFPKVFGSMVADRLSDTITVGLLLLFTFIVASNAIDAFLSKYPIGRDLVSLISSAWFWLAVCAAFLVIVILVMALRKTKIYRKGLDLLKQLWNGFAVIAKMKGKWHFLFLTALLWTTYFTQFYIAFFAFDFTRELVARPGTCLGLIPALVAWELSSIGMAVPSNGGLGPWNIACIFGLAVYGISEAQGTAFSMLVWSAQTVMLILLGIFTMGYIMFNKKKEEKAEKS